MADTEITISVNEEVAAVWERGGKPWTFAAFGDLERTPLISMYALNKRYLDHDLANVLHSYEGQCVVVMAVLPVRATAQAAHSSLGHRDETLLKLDMSLLEAAKKRER